MEESEKRKERLTAMCMAAAHAEVSSNFETSAMLGCLSNPLSETSPSLAVQDDFCTTQRFDYYTDPMAAFSANKRMGKGDNQTMRQSFASSTTSWPMARPSPSHPGPKNSDRNLPVHEVQSQLSHDHSIYQQGPYRSPRITSPSLMHHGNSDAWNGSQATANYYSFAFDGSPRGMFGTPSMHPGTSSTSWNPPNASRYGNLHSLGFSCAGSLDIDYGRGSPQKFGNNLILGPGTGGSPGFSSGRGWARGYSGSISSGMGSSGRRGHSFHGRCSASQRTLGPEFFFDESMLEDPWQHLNPILWRRQEAGMDSLGTPGSSNSWHPQSVGIKKAKVSDASNTYTSQPTLAEYLAASFNKAVEDGQNA